MHDTQNNSISNYGFIALVLVHISYSYREDAMDRGRWKKLIKIG